MKINGDYLVQMMLFNGNNHNFSCWLSSQFLCGVGLLDPSHPPTWSAFPMAHLCFRHIFVVYSYTYSLCHKNSVLGSVPINFFF